MKHLKYLAFIILFYQCSQSTQIVKNSPIKSGKYYSADSLLLIEFHIKDDSLIGNQCFTFYDGSKLDCCTDASLLLKKQVENTYIGKMKSCYADTFYSVKINFKHDSADFIFIDQEHEFVNKDNLLISK
jgi:hypothetical protein